MSASRPLRILAHNNSRIIGGGEIGTVLLLRGLQQRGHDVHMIVRDASVAERLRDYGVPLSTHRIGGDVMIAGAVTLAARLRAHRPDALILTTFRKIFLTGLAARMARVPFVVQRIVLQGDGPHRGARYRLALRSFVDRVVLNADSMRAAFLAGDARFSPAHLVTITDGVAPPARAHATDVRAELNLPASAVIIGSVGRLAKQKRYDRLIRVLARLPDHAHCVIAGEGEDREELLALAEEQGVRDRVHLLGFRGDVGDVLASFDMYVVSSDREGLSNAMLEAMWLGVPIVSTDVSGARQALDETPEDAQAGLVVGIDERALGDALARLVADAGLRSRLGAAARLRAERRFPVDRFLTEWETLLRTGVAREDRHTR